MVEHDIRYYPKNRPLSFNVLCVLAFGFGGISILVNLLFIINGSLSNSYREFPFLVQILGGASDNIGMIYSILGLVLSVLAFMGVIQMWNLLRSGFWIFSVSQLLYMILPFILLEIPTLHLVYIMTPFFLVVTFFIVLFSFNLKYLE